MSTFFDFCTAIPDDSLVVPQIEFILEFLLEESKRRSAAGTFNISQFQLAREVICAEFGGANALNDLGQLESKDFIEPLHLTATFLTEYAQIKN